jgi:hypothetical protein
MFVHFETRRHRRFFAYQANKHELHLNVFEIILQEPEDGADPDPPAQWSVAQQKPSSLSSLDFIIVTVKAGQSFQFSACPLGVSAISK